MQCVYKPFQPALILSGLNSLGLSMTQCQPSGLLSNVVHSYVSMKVTRPIHYPIMPDGTVSIFIFPEGTFIRGPFSCPVMPYVEKPGVYFGAKFYPGALRLLFKNNIEEISGQVADSHFFECKNFNSIHNEIYGENSWYKQISILESWLLSYWKTPVNDRIGYALNIIYQNKGVDRIECLADKVDISSRHLNRLFRQHTGLSSKGFSQIVRIQDACRRLLLQPEDSSAIAQSLCFTDQAHMLREFNKYYGASPSGLKNRFMSDFYNT